MRNLRIITLVTVVLAFSMLIGGCAWPWQSKEIVVVEDGANDLAESADKDFLLENRAEFVLDTSELVASEFDGPVVWSPDGSLVAINMSNLTLGSAQAILVDAATSETKAIISGYNVRWDKSDPDAIIFSRHMYYGPPDYGSYEETVKVSQEDLLAAGIFNDEVPREVLGEGEITPEVVGISCSQVLDDERVVCSDYVANEKFIVFVMDDIGQVSLYAMPADGNIETDAVKLVTDDLSVEAFTLSPDKSEIIYKVSTGGTDEFGNVERSLETTKFIKATIPSN